MYRKQVLTTILAEIEAQLNSRPLTYLSADPGDYSVITPAQILIGRNLQASPAKDTRVSEHTSRAITKRFQYHQKLVNGFWKRWHAEYLKSLIPLKKWFTVGREIHKGDLVLVSEDNLARGQWQRARVEATHPGRDGLIRSVTLRLTSGSLTRRPVQRLHLFEACDADLAAELDCTDKGTLTNIELDENIIDQFEDALPASGGRMFGTEILFSVRLFGRVGTRP